MSQLRRDRYLGSLISRRPGIRVPGAWDPFELSVRAILGQQVSVAAAVTFANRMLTTFGTPLDERACPGITHVFPTAGDLATADLTRIGVTSRRAKTIAGLAGAFADNRISLNGASNLVDVREQLCGYKGIGPWTAGYIAMRALGLPDAYPENDLGLLRAMQTLGFGDTFAELARAAQSWRPWRAYATMQLWAMTG